MNKKLWICRILIPFCVLLFAAGISSGAVFADGSDTKTVRVGYYENEVFQEGAEDGTVKTGYYQSNAVSSSPAELVYKGQFSEDTTAHFAVNVKRDVGQFEGEEPQYDDMTMVSFTYLGSNGGVGK